jgi:hypothetical protein
MALTTAPQIAEDKDSGYNRSLFKHWIDADKNGCNTRAEVLISEAVVKPKVDKKCKITGGKWLSAYDNKSVTNASQLDVDHLVPLAEAWRSGAWAWTPRQRQDFANDLEDKRALIAVTLSTNRSKGDKDISEWVPKIDTCGYVENWISIKIRYSLTYDSKEAVALSGYFEKCSFGEIPVQALPGYTYQSQVNLPDETSPTPTVSSTPTPTNTSSNTPTPTITPTGCNCVEYTFKNLEPIPAVFTATDCNGNVIDYRLEAYEVFTTCLCEGTINIYNNSLWNLVHTICLVLPSIQASLNIFVFLFCNKLFRNEFQLIMPCCFRKQN